MTRKSVPSRVRAALQKEVDSVCPFCDSEEVEHFEVHHIDEDHSNGDRSNLLMLCPLCHSKITKGEIAMDDVKSRKMELLASPTPAKKASNVVQFTGKVGNAVVGDNNVVNIRNTTKKSPKPKYPEGSIGFENLKANYIGYLIGRYNEYKEWEVGKDSMNYALFPSKLKREFKIGPTRTIYNAAIEQFDNLVDRAQRGIDGTKLAKIKKYKGQLKNYDSLVEFQQQTLVNGGAS